MKRTIIALVFIMFATVVSALTFDQSICFAISPLSSVKPEDLDLEKTKIKFCVDIRCENYVERNIDYSEDWGKHCMDRYDKFPRIVFDEGYPPAPGEEPPLAYRDYKFILVFNNGKTYETNRILPKDYHNYYKITINGRTPKVKALQPDIASCYGPTCPEESPKGLYYEINCEKSKECRKQLQTSKTLNKRTNEEEEKDEDPVYSMDCKTLLSAETCPKLSYDDRYKMGNKLAALAENHQSNPFDMGYGGKCNHNNYKPADDFCKAWSIAGYMEGDFPKNCFKKEYPAGPKDKGIYNELIYKFQSCHKQELAEKEKRKTELEEYKKKNPGAETYTNYWDDDYWD